MTKAAGSKSLKDQNRVPLWLAIAGNLALLYGFARFEEARAMGVTGVIAGASGILPISLALIVTSVANALLSADAKARLVFLRREHALPGHQAFSVHATTDPRIDVDALRQHLGNGWPADPDAENRVWYRFYKEIENDPAILQLHREFLFTRDYAALAALFIPILGVAAIVLVRPPTLCGLYLGLLLVQFGLVRQAAATYGRRLVCTVLARKAATLGGQPAAAPVRAPKAAKVAKNP